MKCTYKSGKINPCDKLSEKGIDYSDFNYCPYCCSEIRIRENLTGLKVGSLTVMGPDDDKLGYWTVLCDCGVQEKRQTRTLLLINKKVKDWDLVCSICRDKVKRAAKCKKIKYTEEGAKKELAKFKELNKYMNHIQHKRYYKCPLCGHWHLTSQRIL